MHTAYRRTARTERGRVATARARVTRQTGGAAGGRLVAAARAWDGVTQPTEIGERARRGRRAHQTGVDNV